MQLIPERLNKYFTRRRDKIGSIPLRRLVYRVKEIPESLFPLIWDFGTLNDATEECYIGQMIRQRIHQFDDGSGTADERARVLIRVLCQSQRYMRRQKDECSFVSLRDVERTLAVLEWVESKRNILHDRIKEYRQFKDHFAVSLALAVGIAYYVRLDDREPYVRHIADFFTGRYKF